MLARDLQIIHEFEADEAVLKKGIDATQYQQLLVAKAVCNRLQPFANNLNHSPLKQRIIMMTKQKSSRAMMLKALIAIPVLALAACSFGNIASSSPAEDEDYIPQPDSTLLMPGGTPASESPIVHWIEDGKNGAVFNKYIVHVPNGTLVDIGGSLHIEEMYYYIFTDEYAEPLMMLDGKPFDRNSLPDSLKCDVVKKLKLDADGDRLTVDIITKPVVIPDTVRSNMIDALSYAIGKTGKLMTDPLPPTFGFGRLDTIPEARLSVLFAFEKGAFRKNPKAVANLRIIHPGTPEDKIDKIKEYLIGLGIDKFVTR